MYIRKIAEKNAVLRILIFKKLLTEMQDCNIILNCDNAFKCRPKPR